MAKAPKIFQPVAATANDLRSGAVVFRQPDGSWSHEVAGAEVADTPEAATRLQAAADADGAANRVVDPVLIAVTRVDGAVRPSALRERIRATGPTYKRRSAEVNDVSL